MVRIRNIDSIFEYPTFFPHAPPTVYGQGPIGVLAHNETNGSTSEYHLGTLLICVEGQRLLKERYPAMEEHYDLPPHHFPLKVE